jgi:hypothetical protein
MECLSVLDFSAGNIDISTRKGDGGGGGDAGTGRNFRPPTFNPLLGKSNCETLAKYPKQEL